MTLDPGALAGEIDYELAFEAVAPDRYTVQIRIPSTQLELDGIELCAASTDDLEFQAGGIVRAFVTALAHPLPARLN